MSEEKIYKVYMHTVPNGKVYIGVTSQEVDKRWNHGQGYRSNLHFWRAIQKYGWSNIRHEVLFEGLTKEEAFEKEIELISLYESNNPHYGYNHTEGGRNVNVEMYNSKPLPPFEEIYNDGFKLSMFMSLLKCCEFQRVTETSTITRYDEDGNEAVEVVETERIIEPNVYAIHTILDSYENEEKLQPIIKKLKNTLERMEEV